MLETLKKYYKYKKPFYGINSGDYGFLMNKFSEKKLIHNLHKTDLVKISPLQMVVKNQLGKTKKSIAINEISILRQSRQAVSISIKSGSKYIIRKNMQSLNPILKTEPALALYRALFPYS